MRHIDKSNRCTDFDAYQKPANWGNFKPSQKLKLHQHLLGEQRFLCIYCQQRLEQKAQKDNHAGGLLHPSHIEHVRPKAVFPAKTFEYENLVASCNGFEAIIGPQRKGEFCGHPKDDSFDDALFLHPYECVDIESFFEYDLVSGKIQPSKKDPNRAKYMIDLLQLDHQILNGMRLTQYEITLLDQQNGVDMDAYFDEKADELPPFISMLKQFFSF